MSDYPSKLYYSISEVAEITGVKAHVLRYWESEFPTLKPRKARAGSRRYRQQDIEEIQAIKTLLYEEGFKIAGARKQRREAKKGGGAAAQQTAAPQMALSLDGKSDRERLEMVRDQLREVLEGIRGLRLAAAPAVKPKAKKGKA